MKTLKNILILLLLLISGIWGFAQEPATLTLVSNKTVEGAGPLVVSLDRHMNARTWDKKFVSIIITIKMHEVSRDVAKLLVLKKRYQVKATCVDGRTLNITMPNIVYPLIINQEKITEEISYDIFVPSNYSVDFPKGQPSENDNNEVIKIGS